MSGTPMLRAHFRGVDAHPDELLLPRIFEIDQKMRAALPNGDSFSYLSVLEAVCPEHQCPLTVDDGTPLTVDHAHLTAEGSAYVSAKLMPELGLKRKKVPGAPMAQPGPEESIDNSGN